MDYALQIVQRWAHESPEDVVERIKSGEEQAPDPAEIRRMAGVLTTALPTLTRADAPKGWKLTHAGSGARISMQGDEFRIEVPRTHAVATARSTWNDLWVVLRGLETEGYAVYDPQLERLLDLHSDLEVVVREYAGAPTEQSTPAAALPAKPWWKLW